MAQKCIIFYSRHFGSANVNVQFDGGYGRAINMNTNIYVRNRFNHKALNVTLTFKVRAHNPSRYFANFGFD